MKFFMEKNKDVGHRVRINIPRAIVNKKFIEECTKINQKTSINGFRKGKVPIKIIEKKYGNSIYYDVFNKLMQKFFQEFLQKEKIKIIGIPKYFIHPDKDTKNDLEYSVIYEKYPYFKIKNINHIQIEKINVNITDNDIKELILKKNKWKKTNRSIKNYDQITINYCIYENNVRIKKIDSENIKFIVLQNNLIAELNTKVLNHFVGDIIFLKLNFSPFHPDKKLCNKDVTLKIKILEIKEKEEIIEKIKNDNFSKDNQKTLKNKIKEKVKILTNNYFKNQIIENLIKKNPIKIPPILLKEEINCLYNKSIEEYERKKDNILDQKYHLNLKSLAEKRLKIKLIFDQIITENKISIQESQIQSLIHQISLNYKRPVEIVNLYNKNKTLKKTIEQLVLENEIIQLLTKKIKTIEKNLTFNEIKNYKWNKNKEFLA